MVKNLNANAREGQMWVQEDQEDSLEQEMANRSSILAWKIP